MSYIRLQRLRELAEKSQQTLNVNRLLPLTYASLNFSSCKLTAHALFYLEIPLCIRFKSLPDKIQHILFLKCAPADLYFINQNGVPQ